MLEYVGNGAYLQGVPARDLSDDEAIEYGGEAALVASGLYVQRTEVGPLVEPSKETDETILRPRRRASEVKHGG